MSSPEHEAPPPARPPARDGVGEFNDAAREGAEQHMQVNRGASGQPAESGRDGGRGSDATRLTET